VLRYPAGGGLGTCSVVHESIEVCVGYFWEELQEEQRYSRWRRTSLERKRVWKEKEMDTAAALRIIDVYVRD
jgi:hypothetical protein